MIEQSPPDIHIADSAPSYLLEHPQIVDRSMVLLRSLSLHPPQRRLRHVHLRLDIELIIREDQPNYRIWNLNQVRGGSHPVEIPSGKGPASLPEPRQIVGPRPSPVTQAVVRIEGLEKEVDAAPFEIFEGEEMGGEQDPLDVEGREGDLALVDVVEDALQVVWFHLAEGETRVVARRDRGSEILGADDQDDLCSEGRDRLKLPID